MSTPLDPLSPRGQRMVGVLWPPEQEDPSTIAIMRAGADELDSIEDLMTTVRDQAWAHKADDTYGLLEVHERMLGVPIKPSGVPLVVRQNSVKSAMQARKVGSARQWVRRMEALMRGNPWRYQRNHPGRGQITITIPFTEATYSAGQVAALAAKVTPAHLEIIVRYEAGWIAGVSRVGDPV